jgi:apolipoprotein N-acyltransferase
VASAGRAALWCTLGGLLQAASFAPLQAWPLQIVGLALLMHALRDAAPRRASALGWLFAFVWLTASLWWVFISMHRYGGMAAPLAALATALLGAVLALYYALAAAAWSRWRAAGGLPAAGFAAFWLLAELARGLLFTGFPWAAGGYAHTVGPLAPWAPWIGVYGIGALAAWLAAALAMAWQRRTTPRRAARALAPALAALLVGWVLPGDFTRGTGVLSVSLLQPNVPQDEKFDQVHIERVLGWHLDALREARGTLVVTPESSIPLPAQHLDPAYLAALREPFTQGERAALVGVFVGSDVEGYTNSLVALSGTSGLGQADAWQYGKRHLLPFGEFIPPGFGWFVSMMDIPIGDQARGRSTASLPVGGQRVRPLICYEDLFGEDIVDSVVSDDGATVLANSTNLAWFGRWMVQDQHLQFSQMRALEFQRPVVRATNTGSTAAVDHRGTVIARLPAERVGVLDAAVEGRTGATPYARWLAAHGLWPLAAMALAVLALARPRRALPTLESTV